ncbi:MAG: helix-turn-helix transcriptional regulator [Chloroflexota bacterium]
MPDDCYEKHCRHRPRKDEHTTWGTVEAGKRFRRGRLLVGLSQRAVAAKAGVSQSEISRFERGMTPHMSAYKVLEIGLALGPRFPFGYCPHDHQCANARPSMESELWERLDAKDPG